MGTVVLLLSDKRSGSTILQDELCRHPEIQTVAYSSHTYLETQHWLKGAALLDYPARSFSGGKVYPTYAKKGVARRYIVDTLQGNLPDYTPPADDLELVLGGWEALCDRFATPVFFEKSPQIIAHWAALDLILAWAAQTKHEVKFITLVRNPMAVLYSAEALFSSAPAARQFGWASLTQNMLAFERMVAPESLLRVHYEDLLADPPGRFADICRFIGVAPDAAVGGQMHAKSREKWRGDADFTLSLHPAVARMAQAVGYGAEDLTNPNAAPGTAPGAAQGAAAYAAPKVQGRPLKAQIKSKLLNTYLRPAYLGLKARLTR